MARRLTLKDAEARLRDLDHQNTLLTLGLHQALTAEPSAVEPCEADGWRYSLSLYAPTAPHGGLVLVRAETENQSPSITVHYLDELWESRARLYGTRQFPFIVAVDRLRIARTRVLDEGGT